MLGPLTIVSLDQGKLYGKSMNPDLALWWQSAVPIDADTATVEGAPVIEASRTGFLAAIWSLLCGFAPISLLFRGAA